MVAWHPYHQSTSNMEKPPNRGKTNEPILEDKEEISLSFAFNNREYSDYTLIALPYATSTRFFCHKIILSQLPYFRSLINTTMKGESKEPNTGYVKISETSLRIILSYLYQVKEPLSSIRVTTENSTVIFDEIASVNYKEPLLDLWTFITKNLPEDQTTTDEVLYMEKAELHKLPFSLKTKPRVKVISSLRKETLVYALHQDIETNMLQYPIEYSLNIKFLWAATWCASTCTKTSREDRFDVLNVITTMSKDIPIDKGMIANIAKLCLKLGKCDAIITYAGYIVCGISPIEMKEDPKFKERDIIVSLEEGCINCGDIDCLNKRDSRRTQRIPLNNQHVYAVPATPYVNDHRITAGEPVENQNNYEPVRAVRARSPQRVFVPAVRVPLGRIDQDEAIELPDEENPSSRKISRGVRGLRKKLHEHKDKKPTEDKPDDTDKDINEDASV